MARQANQIRDFVAAGKLAAILCLYLKARQVKISLIGVFLRKQCSYPVHRRAGHPYAGCLWGCYCCGW